MLEPQNRLGQPEGKLGTGIEMRYLVGAASILLRRGVSFLWQGTEGLGPAFPGWQRQLDLGRHDGEEAVAGVAGTVRAPSLVTIPSHFPSLVALTHHHGHSPSRCPAGALLEGQGPPPQWWEGDPFQVPPPPKCGGVRALGSQGRWLQGAAQGQHSLSHLVAAHEPQPPTQQVLGAERQVRGLLGSLDAIPMCSAAPHSSPLLWVEATEWLAGCWASLGCTEGSGWLGARKGTKECQGNTATERGSTFVHTVGRSQLSCAAGNLGLESQLKLISTLDEVAPSLLHTPFHYPRAPWAHACNITQEKLLPV